MRTSNEGMNINRTLQFLSNTEISTIYLVSSRNFDSKLGWLRRVDHLQYGEAKLIPSLYIKGINFASPC